MREVQRNAAGAGAGVGRGDTAGRWRMRGVKGYSRGGHGGCSVWGDSSAGVGTRVSIMSRVLTTPNLTPPRPLLPLLPHGNVDPPLHPHRIARKSLQPYQFFKKSTQKLTSPYHCAGRSCKFRPSPFLRGPPHPPQLPVPPTTSSRGSSPR